MPVRSATVLTGLPWRDAGAEQRQTAHSALERLAVGVGAGALLRPDLAELGTAHRATRPVAWDPRQRRLAVVDAHNRVAIYCVAPGALQLQEGAVERLTHAGCIHDIRAVAWRPNAKDTLAVAHSGGVCIWSCEQASQSDSGRGLGAASGWRRDTLQYGQRLPVSELSWSPCGSFLACGSHADHCFNVWEVATRTCTRLREGFGGARLLRWSPRGNFLLVAGYGVERFHIWETHTWTCQSWKTGERPLVDAAWLPDETCVLIAFQQRIAALHFVKEPPSVTAHLLPLDLPNHDGFVDGLAFSQGILAVATRTADGNRSGVNIYGLRTSPVFAATFIGSVDNLESSEEGHAACVAISGSTVAVTTLGELMLADVN